MSIRTTDTRRKIELGGLVIKAALEHESKAVIFGALMLASKALNGTNAESIRARFSAAGDAAFGEPSHAE